LLPVVMYKALLLVSTSGVDQIGTPDGPHICVPTAFFDVCRGSSTM